MTTRPSLDEAIARRKFSAGDDGQFYKAVVVEDAEGVERGYDPEARAQRFVMSSETADLYGDIVRQDGMKIENFMKNPVGLAYHNHRAPIGKWSDLKTVRGKPKRTEGLLTLFAEGVSEDADAIGRLLGADAIRACSIGFMPDEMEWILDANGKNTYGLDFKSSVLLECSVCSIPANPDALAKAAGGDARLAGELFELLLDTYCERTTGGLYVRKEYEDAYLEMKGRKTVSVPPTDNKVTVDETDAPPSFKEMESMLSKLAETFKSLLGLAEKKIEESEATPEVTVSEPEPALPVMIEGSRAKANAKTAKLRASLRAKGYLK